MIDCVAYYQFGFYAPGTHVEPTPDLVGRLLESLKDKGFVPTTSPEIEIGPSPNMRLQLQFITQDQQWNLAFEDSRVLLHKKALPDSEVGRPEDFCSETQDVFGRLTGVTEFHGTRMSYVTKGLLPEMTNDELEQANSLLINLPPFYSEHPPCEWTTRHVARYDVSIGEETETLNVITDINRRQGQLAKESSLVPFDRLEISFDINTYQGNTDQRFGVDDVGPFLTQALTLSRKIQKEIGEKFPLLLKQEN